MELILENFPVHYYPTPKAGSSTIKYALFELDYGENFKEFAHRKGIPQSVHKFYHRRDVKSLDSEKRFKFCVVRDPIERFISAYSDIIVNKNLLSKTGSARKALKVLKLPLQPDLNTFVDNLECYRRVHRSMLHHTEPQIRFLGYDLSLYDEVCELNNISALADKLGKVTGKTLQFEFKNSSNSKLSTADLLPTSIKKLVRLYDVDYRLLRNFYHPPTVDNVPPIVRKSSFQKFIKRFS